MRGRFITFEGGEGTGKSTHAALLAQKLRAFGIGVVLTREPGGSPGAEIIRHVLLSGGAKPFGPHAEAILFAAARDDHVRTIIGPSLDRGRWVICDRFTDSMQVYQGIAGNVDPKLISGLERITIGDLKPDITFVLDVPADIGLARAKLRSAKDAPDRFESEAFEFHEKLREGFRLIAMSNPNRCVLIDARDSRQAVADKIWKVVNDRFDPATAPVALGDMAS
ncbi:MAG TPA: dTMP kinase [Xanthobacteraceae bacterium]|jgi:dTMP kinase|nr:dTMP kinase [Xanthobacteraceae bacterium]